MLHFIKEGSQSHIGLNVYFGRYWVSIRYVWVDLPNLLGTCRYLHFGLRRPDPHPTWKAGVTRWDLVENYLFDCRRVVLTQEQYQNLVSLKELQ